MRPRIYSQQIESETRFTNIGQISSDVKFWSVTNPTRQRLMYSFTGKFGDGQENLLLPGTRIPFNTGVNNFFVRLEDAGMGFASVIVEVWTWEEYSKVTAADTPYVPTGGVRSKREPGSERRGVGPQKTLPATEQQAGARETRGRSERNRDLRNRRRNRVEAKE
ncbi:hypothetical protein LCGC14_1049560 [marine sediment metagenome]|uniref:Uncharacterized protein n=1 Tax=marine sediment metagenome TaxID=412755 RepID=A0A0F9QV98_9ZZZZ